MPDDIGPEPTRLAILRAAEREFGAHGYRHTSVEQVARAAGLSRALVYRYFGDKEELFRQLVAAVLRDWNDELASVAERPAPTWAHTLRQVIRTCVVSAAERQFLRAVLLQDGDLAQRVARRTLDEGRSLLPRLLVQILQRGIDAGAVRADLAAEEMAFVIGEITIAASLQAMRSSPTAMSESRLEAVVETILHGILLSGATP